MIEFRLSLDHVQDRIVIKVAGDLDSTSCPALTDLVLQDVPPGSHAIVDLSELTFVDTSGLGVLVSLWKRLDQSGGSLVLAGARYSNARALWVTGLAERMPLSDDLETALSGKQKQN